MSVAPRWRMRVLAVAALFAALGGCGAGRDGSPSETPHAAQQTSWGAVLASASTPDSSRIAADRKLVQASGAQDDTRLALLEQILLNPGHSTEMRLYALEQLAAANKAQAGKVLTLHLPKIDDWPVLQRACAMAVELGDLRLADALIRSWARPATQFQRPERPEKTALEKLCAQRAPIVLREKITDSNDRTLRVCALDLLVELDGAPAVKKWVKELPARDVFLDDLAWWVETFDTVPQGAQEMAWVHLLRKPQQVAWVEQAKKRWGEMRGEKDFVMVPRLVYVLAETPEAVAKMSRAELLRDLGEKLDAKKHVKRVPSYEGARDDVDDTLAAQEKKLSRLDLWALELLLTGLDDLALRRELHRLGLLDMSDTTTEHGGLLTLIDGHLRATPYRPLYTGNDNAYITSDLLLTDMACGVSGYHFHFQEVYNGRNAGPGVGDLQFTRENHCHGVVFTSVGTGELNGDYYTPQGAVVDLGVWRITP